MLSAMSKAQCQALGCLDDKDCTSFGIFKLRIGASQVTGQGRQCDKHCDRLSLVSLVTEKPPTPACEVREGFSELLYLMIDLSCLEDICGDPNFMLKPIEHTV